MKLLPRNLFDSVMKPLPALVRSAFRFLPRFIWHYSRENRKDGTRVDVNLNLGFYLEFSPISLLSERIKAAADYVSDKMEITEQADRDFVRFVAFLLAIGLVLWAALAVFLIVKML